MATLRKRGKRWQAIVRRFGRTRAATFDTKTAASAWAKRIEAEADSNRALGGVVRGTIGDMIDAYERETRGIKPWGRSKSGAFRTIRRHLGGVAIDQLNKDVLMNFAAARRDEGAGPPTILMDISYISTMFGAMRDLKGWNVDTRHIADAKAALSRQGLIAKAGERTRRPTLIEIDRLIEFFARNRSMIVPMHDLIPFAIASGMRKGEIAGLLWDDLDEDRRLVMIRDRKDPKRKIGNNQWIPLLDVTGYDALEIILRQPRTDVRIWPVNAGTISTIFPRACRKLGIADLRWHDFRREAASRMLKAGMPIEQVAIITGHREWRTLQRYAVISAPDVVAQWSFRSPASTPEPSQ